MALVSDFPFGFILAKKTNIGKTEVTIQPLWKESKSIAFAAEAQRTPREFYVSPLSLRLCGSSFFGSLIADSIATNEADIDI